MDNSVKRGNEKKELSKDEAVMLLYEAIDKIHRGTNCKSDYVLESIIWRLSEVQNKYVLPKIIDQSGQSHADTMLRIHAVVNPYPLKEISKA